MDVYVAECDVGRGIFAARNFLANEEILRFTGPVISLAEAVAKGDDMGNPLQIGDLEYVDVEPPGVFVNHSCDPNAGIVADRTLVALRAIAEHEEIRFDYSTTMLEDMWTMPCKCGSGLCRGTVGDFIYLPPSLQEAYLRRGIVQRFIARRLSWTASLIDAEGQPAVVTTRSIDSAPMSP